MYDADVPTKVRELSLVIVSYRFCCSQGPSSYLCSYVYLDVEAFSRGFSDVVGIFEINSVSSTSSDDSDDGFTLSLSSSFTEAFRKLMADCFYRRQP